MKKKKRRDSVNEAKITFQEMIPIFIDADDYKDG